MSIFNCSCRRDCVAVSVIASIAVGVLVAFLRITGVITVAPAALIAAFGIAVVYLAVTLVTSALLRLRETVSCQCRATSAAVAGALITVFAAAVLLAVTFVTTSVVGAIVTGALAAGFTLLLTATACLIRCIAGCNE